MSIDFEEIENGNKPPPRCELCKGWGYRFPPGAGSPIRCENCKGTKISQRRYR